MKAVAAEWTMLSWDHCLPLRAPDINASESVSWLTQEWGTSGGMSHTRRISGSTTFSMKPLTQYFDAPMQFYSVAAVIRPRSGGRPLIFRPLTTKIGRGSKLSHRLSLQQDVAREILWSSTEPLATRAERSRAKQVAWQEY